jgi:integrase
VPWRATQFRAPPAHPRRRRSPPPPEERRGALPEHGAADPSHSPPLVAPRRTAGQGLSHRRLVDGVRVPKPQKRALTLDEAQRLLAAARDDRLGALYATLLELGPRLGEALGLRWEDLDLDDATLAITRRLDRAGGTAETKTQGSRRTLHLSAGLVAALRRHADRQAYEMLRAGDLWVERGFVFTSEVGKLTPHELRHSAATLLLARGVPLHVVSEVLGHSSIRETKDVYGHLVAEDSRRAAQAMGERSTASEGPAYPGVSRGSAVRPAVKQPPENSAPSRK